MHAQTFFAQKHDPCQVWPFDEGTYVKSTVEILYGDDALPMGSYGVVVSRGTVNWRGFGALDDAEVYANEIQECTVEEVATMKAGLWVHP